MKKQVLITTLLLATVLGIGIWLRSRRPESTALRVGVFLFAQHPVITEIDAGFRDELETQAAQHSTSITYVERNADGQAAQANTIAGYFKNTPLDAIFVVGLPAAQALKATGVETPVIVGGPPDPIAAGLVPRLTRHGTKFTGTRYMPPTDLILTTYRQLYPTSTTVAVLHNPGEANSMAVVNDFKASAKRQNISLIDYGAGNITELETTLRVIATSKPDAVFIPTDNLIHAALDRVLAVCKQADVPVFDCTQTSVEKGAVFSIGTDYRRIGALSADVAGKILFGKNAPETVDWMDVQGGHVYVKTNINNKQAIQPPPGYSIINIP